MARSPFDGLRHLIALARRDAGVRAAAGNLSLASVARAVGTSPRSLGRYLSGERIPPDAIGARMIDLAVNVAADLAPYLRERARAQGIPYAAPRRGKVLSVRRYERPMIVQGAPEPSRVIIVDVQGMRNAEVARIISDYWSLLRDRNESWDLRLQANIEIKEYFGEKRRDVEDKSLRKLTANKSTVEIWLPPQRFIFTRSTGKKGVKFLRYPNAGAMLAALNESMYHPRFGNYLGRLPEEYTFSRLAFIPTTAPLKREKRYQKRKGKH